MKSGQIGGALVLGGWLLFAVAAATVAGGGPVGIGGGVGVSNGSIVLAAALGLAGSGAALLGIAGAVPLNGRGLRVGLGVLSVGLLSSVGAWALGGAVPDYSLAFILVIVLLFVGTVATALGTLITLAALVRAGGRPRVVGALFLAGLALLTIGGLLTKVGLVGPLGEGLRVTLIVLGGFAVVLGGVGLGLLGLIGDRSALPPMG